MIFTEFENKMDRLNCHHSDQLDVLENFGDVEAGSGGHRGLPGEIPGRFEFSHVNSEQIDFELLDRLASSDYVESDPERSLPATLDLPACILSQVADLVLSAELRAVACGIGDVCEEELAVGADFQFEVFGGVGVGCGDEDLNSIGIVEGIVTALVGSNDLFILAGPRHNEMVAVMAKLGFGGVRGIFGAIVVGERKDGDLGIATGRNVQADC
jgi:hypothetical protein